jgi:hypothetical protein
LYETGAPKAVVSFFSSFIVATSLLFNEFLLSNRFIVLSANCLSNQELFLIKAKKNRKNRR